MKQEHCFLRAVYADAAVANGQTSDAARESAWPGNLYNARRATLPPACLADKSTSVGTNPLLPYTQ